MSKVRVIHYDWAAGRGRLVLGVDGQLGHEAFVGPEAAVLCFLKGICNVTGNIRRDIAYELEDILAFREDPDGSVLVRSYIEGFRVRNENIAFRAPILDTSEVNDLIAYMEWTGIGPQAKLQ